MRNALELETTAQPAAANCGSSSRAIEASRAAKIIFGVPFGLAGETFISAIGARMALFKRQRAASAYVRPSERSDAASHDTSNHGSCSSIWINLCPTMPVAPRIPTGSLLGMVKCDFIPASSLTSVSVPDARCSGAEEQGRKKLTSGAKARHIVNGLTAGLNRPRKRVALGAAAALSGSSR